MSAQIIRRCKQAVRLMLFAVCAAFLSTPNIGQVTTSTGSIQGVIVDAKGGAVTSAKVTISNKATGQAAMPSVNDSGVYVSGALKPGEYLVRVEAAGFKTAELTVMVEVGVVSSGNLTLEVGSEKTIVAVEASAITVNAEQATVQGVLTSQQIETLPLNGRNFLDLAQLEPGVQIQDGANFDPTKNGFSSISFAGHFGRTTRIEVDGVDISDETVGTTTQNIPQSAIREFQIGQSSLDLSTELTSTGTVNVVTRSGANAIHGEGFFYWRGDSVSAKLGSLPSPFDRKQFGARLGGPILKDKLFFFGGFERAQQSLQSLQVIPAPFNSLSSSFDSPFHDTMYIGRLDWAARPDLQVFYRFSYEQNRTVKGVIPNNFQPFANADNTPVHAMGVDYSHGSWTHSLRVGYTKFRNGINDAVLGSNIFDPAPGIAIEIGGDAFCLTAGVDPLCTGPNFLAPQKTFQSNKQTKYDGTKTMGRHTLRFGGGVNRIQGGVFAAFIGSAPIVGSNFNLPTGANASDPLQYTVTSLAVGNGQGFFTERPGFGFPGGESADTRIQFYFGDVWKVKPNLSLTLGLRYVRDSGRTDSDLPPIPCSATTLFTCNGNLVDQFGAGLGGRVAQPNKNFAPQIGIAWDPQKNHKTVIRGGFSLGYENALFNNVLFDRSGRLAQGLFLVTQNLCPAGQLILPGGGSVTTVPSSGHDIATQVCGQPIGNVVNDAIELENIYRQATLTAGPQSNGGFIGNLLADSFNITLTNLLAPNYRSPYSMEFNAGVSRELRPGTVLTVDYLRNVALHGLIGVDSNHVGDARFLNAAAALNAISATNSAKGCGTGTDATAINCAIGKGATIFDYAGNGLDSGNAFNGGGLSAYVLGRTPDTGAAFAGANPNVGTNQMLFPIGRSIYNALQAKLTTQWNNPLPGLQSVNAQVSYAYSRATAAVRDVDFIANAYDFRNASLSGPNGLDRTHQFSAGASFRFKYGAELSFITHWNSPLPADIKLPTPASAVGAIFTSDLTGDGSYAGNTLGASGDLLPGTKPGAFGRDFGVGGLTKLIDSYNANVAGKTLTPAGQALVDAGLFTQAQLFALGATPQPIADPPPGQVGLDSFFTFDLRLGWNIRVVKKWERLQFSPQVNIYNLFNRQNYDSPSLPLSGILNGAPGFLNGTTAHDQAGCPADLTKCTGRTNLIGLGSGVFALGAPRSLEFGFRVTF
jgi:carboxypeptidase family protein